MVKNLSAKAGDAGWIPRIRKVPWRRKWQPTPVLLGFLGRSVGKETTCNAEDSGSNLGREDPLEKRMSAHSSFLACRMPWTEEPGRIQSM